MAEQTPDNALSMLSETFEKLNEAQRNLDHCKEERAAAGDVLAASEDFLRRIKSTLNNLQRERELRHRRDENRTKLETLKSQIENKQEEETRARQNLKTAQNNLTVLEKKAPISLKQDENGTKPEDAESPSQDGGQAGVEASGEKQNPLKEKQEEKQRAEGQVDEARKVLKEKKRAVIRAAILINIQAEKIPLNAVKEGIFRLGKWLQFTGMVGCGYAYAVLLGVMYEVAFYCRDGINILDYSMLEDFFLAGLKLLIIPLLAVFLSLILLIIYWRLISKLARLPIPRYTEYMAGVFPRFAERIPVKTLLVFFLVLPLTISYGSGHLRLLYNATQVSVVTTRSLQLSGGSFTKIGSNSAYFFIRSAGQSDNNDKASNEKTETKDARPLLAIPVSQIVCISEDDNGDKGCESAATGKGTEQNPTQQNIVLSKESNPWIGELIQALEENVTEDGVRQYISQQMNCDKDRLEVSGFIRFGRNEAELDPTEEQKVFTFIDEWKEKWGDRSAQCKVFGFASADGEQTGNNSLSSQRVEKVKNLLGDELNPLCDNIEVEKGIGEDHPINGVANSRSARIAVCAE